jgi:hypothetical protein
MLTHLVWVAASRLFNSIFAYGLEERAEVNLGVRERDQKRVSKSRMERESIHNARAV